MSSRRSRSGGSWISIGVEAEQQVLPEPARRDLAVQVGVGRREDADVDPARARGADALELARLEHAQQLGLQAERHVGDLVEEERAAVGELEAPDAVGLGVGEGALHVAEQLALEDALREPAGVHRHERPATRATTRAWSACATMPLPVPFSPVISTLASEGPTRAIELQHRLHGRRLGDERRRAGPVGAQRAVLGLEPLAAPQRAPELDLGAQGREQALVLPGLLHEVAGAPRRIASTATSTLPHAVITITGSGESSCWSRDSSESPSWPEVVSRV